MVGLLDLYILNFVLLTLMLCIQVPPPDNAPVS